MRKLLISSAISFGLLASPALASTNCGPRDAVVKSLSEKFGESTVFTGMGTQPIVVELWVSEENHTFSLTTTNMQGTTCLIHSGTDYVLETPPPLGTPS